MNTIIKDRKATICWHKEFNKPMEIISINGNVAKVLVLKSVDCEEAIKTLFPEVKTKARLATVRKDDLEFLC